MKNLNFDLKQMCQRNHDGSFATRADRERMLSLMANTLAQLGYGHMSAQSLRTKHVEALVLHWQQQGLNAGSIKNRMTALRWWAEKVNKQNVVKRTNAEYGIGNRVFVTNASKSITVDGAQLARVTDPFARASLLLEAAFGLRREESIKIIPARADGGDRLCLSASWTKGGKARVIPITTQAQRDALDNAKRVAGRGSLIPQALRYRDQLQKFRYQCELAGISHVHGLRHRYAQDRYLALTGWKCPADGGPLARQLSADQKARDRAARLAISEEMGHYREQITALYCGR